MFRSNIFNYSSTGDSLSWHTDKPFTTRDRDHDHNSANCAQNHKGAWWYNDCHSSNLNGLYLKGPHDSYADGINWEMWRGHHYSLKYVDMKIRAKR